NLPKRSGCSAAAGLLNPPSPSAHSRLHEHHLANDSLIDACLGAVTYRERGFPFAHAEVGDPRLGRERDLGVLRRLASSRGRSLDREAQAVRGDGDNPTRYELTALADLARDADLGGGVL